ncbi:hypothetical protein SLEP1_g39718 [Rubroshorea leprosula]|uniref:Uncharacterized protein n=1 Tax=Rubroshorea leprosula TaxID=152421 RepID=A0AAV5L1C9_9ROSI|nr:hypothetical protein SLEP1_g39718 [Rubroshorea leprosula]
MYEMTDCFVILNLIFHSIKVSETVLPRLKVWCCW